MFFFQLINFKMSERRSLGSWGNLDSSINFKGSLFEGSSRFGWKHYDDSISGGLKLGVDEQDLCNGVHPFANENTINFSDITDRKFIQNSQYMPLRPTNFNQTRLTDIFNWAPTPNTKKGLKQFAALLLKIILRRRCTSHQEITAEIEKLLVNPNNQHRVYSKEERLELKNIKRRIYDALNVMISAGILSRSIYGIQQNHSFNTSNKNYSIINKKNELQASLSELKSRIARKKQLLAKTESQFEALRKSYQQKFQQASHANGQRLQFPLIILVMKKQSKVAINMQGEGIKICHRNVAIYSETDLMEQTARIQLRERDVSSYIKLQMQLSQVAIE